MARQSSVSATPSGSGSRPARLHTSCAVVSAPTFDRAFARWCFTVECDRPRRWAQGSGRGACLRRWVRSAPRSPATAAIPLGAKSCETSGGATGLAAVGRMTGRHPLRAARERGRRGPCRAGSHHRGAARDSGASGLSDAQRVGRAAPQHRRRPPEAAARTARHPRWPGATLVLPHLATAAAAAGRGARLRQELAVRRGDHDADLAGDALHYWHPAGDHGPRVVEGLVARRAHRLDR